jgi:hypothetical protein
MSDTDNWLTRTGANELAYRVRAFWQDRGAVVEVRVEPVAGELGCAQIFGLRSDLGLYLPQRERNPDAVS